MNVAMTRARYQLFCVGDAIKGTLSQSGAVTLESVVRDAQDRGCVTTAKEVLVVHKPPPPKRRLPEKALGSTQQQKSRIGPGFRTGQETKSPNGVFLVERDSRDEETTPRRHEKDYNE